MKFTVTGRYPSRRLTEGAYLTWDNWNDYSYYTLFGLLYVDNKLDRHDIGAVKIGYVEMPARVHPLKEGDIFDHLPAHFFSLGTDATYYENLNELGHEIRNNILDGLNDIAKNPEQYDLAIKQNVTQTSLLRSLSPRTVTGQFKRICNGGALLTNYNFSFKTPRTSRFKSFSLKFDVIAKAKPPTNIHVLIGRNGVGKTHLINQMINSLLSDKEERDSYGEFSFEDELDIQFANLVSVSFSAFDESEPKPEQKDKTKGLLYYYIGLKKLSKKQVTENEPKSTVMLRDEFFENLKECTIEPKKEYWKEAITKLESDTHFQNSQIKALIDVPEAEWKKEGLSIFKRLSSGHKIILLTITRLISVLQEKTLVIIDEPEAHLHPPLLSAFIRTISDLLTKTNGVAIIATHSPVILQEVPRNCAWKLRRSGTETTPERLRTESFGENVGILTSEVFGLEVTSSGFYNILEDQVETGKSYEDIIIEFKGQIGMEGKAILMALIANRDQNV